MNGARKLKAGWLRSEFQAAAKEFDTWPSGMRREFENQSKTKIPAVSKHTAKNAEKYRRTVTKKITA